MSAEAACSSLEHPAGGGTLKHTRMHLSISFRFVNSALCLWRLCPAFSPAMMRLWPCILMDGYLSDKKKLCYIVVLSPLEYVLLEDNSPLSRALEDKRLPDTLFRTLPSDNHGNKEIFVEQYKRTQPKKTCKI